MTTDRTLDEWTDNGPHWVRHSEQLHSMLAPITEALLEEARIAPGQSVLDIAGGAGEPSLTIARVVGPTGTVMCTDAVEEMLVAAKRRAKELGLTNVEFRKCLADSLTFADDSFDAVVCRLGFMFFPDPKVALNEMLRIVKPGGRVSLAVWHNSELNPFCSVTTKVMSRHVPTEPVDKDAPGAFRFAEPGKLEALMSDAGAIDVHERVLDFQIQAPINFAEYWEMRSHTSGKLREQLATLSSEEAETVAAEVGQVSREFFVGDRMSFPAAIILVTGTKI